MQLPRPERPSLTDETDPATPARLGTLQEPMERTEDIRETPPDVLQKLLAEPEEKIGEQNWVVMMFAKEGCS